MACPVSSASPSPPSSGAMMQSVQHKGPHSPGSRIMNVFTWRVKLLPRSRTVRNTTFGATGPVEERVLQKRLALLSGEHWVILVWDRKKAIGSLSGCDWNSGRNVDRKGRSVNAQTKMRNKSKGHPCYIVVKNWAQLCKHGMEEWAEPWVA